MQGTVSEIQNGNTTAKFIYYYCDQCGLEIPENHPHYKNNDYLLCLDCSFIKNHCTEKEYLACCGISLNNAHATIKDNTVVVWVGKIPPWNRKDADYRNTKQYREWRKKVFERDNYTCQDCKTVGGNLEAHHIKSFKYYVKLRYKVSNGITYCVKCHRLRHRKGD